MWLSYLLCRLLANAYIISRMVATTTPSVWRAHPLDYAIYIPVVLTAQGACPHPLTVPPTAHRLPLSLRLPQSLASLSLSSPRLVSARLVSQA